MEQDGLTSLIKSEGGNYDSLPLQSGVAGQKQSFKGTGYC